MDTERITPYNVEGELVPTLETSDDQDTHHPYILSYEGHSAAALILCSPTENPNFPGHKYHIVSSFVTYCEPLEQIPAKCLSYIDKIINSSFEPGWWLTGGCTNLLPRNANAPCEKKTRQVLLELLKDHENGSADNGSVSGGGSTDEQIVEAMTKKLSAGVRIISDGVRHHDEDTLGNQLASYRKGNGDNGSGLESILWDDAAEKERNGTEAAWNRRYLFGGSRQARRNMGVEIPMEPKRDIQKKKQQVEESSRFLNDLVDMLHKYLGPLALAFVSAAAVKDYVLSAVLRLGVYRRAKILKMVADRLRRIPVSLPLHFRVLFPPIYLTYNQQRDKPARRYAELCKATGFSRLKSLEFTEAELAEFEWGIPIKTLLAKQSHEKLRIISRNGVDFVTGSVKGDADAEAAAGAGDSDGAEENTMSEGAQRVTTEAGRKRGHARPQTRARDKRTRTEYGEATDGHRSPLADPAQSGLLSPPASQQQPLFQNAWASTPHDSHSQPSDRQWNSINGQQPRLMQLMHGAPLNDWQPRPNSAPQHPSPGEHNSWHISLAQPNLGAGVDSMQTEGQAAGAGPGGMWGSPIGNNDGDDFFTNDFFTNMLNADFVGIDLAVDMSKV